MLFRPSFFYFLFYRLFLQQVRVGGRNKNENKIHLDQLPIELKSKETRFVFPLILIQLENGQNEFYFYFTNQNGNISPGAVTGGNSINLAAVEKTKQTNIIELQYSTGMSRSEIKK